MWLLILFLVSFPTLSHADGLTKLSTDEKKEIEEKCGRAPNAVPKMNDRILDGMPVQPGQFPSAVFIRSSDYQVCGGTIITPRHVWTASHCLNDGTTTRVFGGGICLEQDEAICSKGVDLRELPVKYIFKANDPSTDDDFAIIELAQPIPKNDSTLDFACLPARNEPCPEQLRPVGWGNYEDNFLSAYLRMTKVSTTVKPGSPLTELCNLEFYICGFTPAEAERTAGSTTGDTGGGAYGHSKAKNRDVLFGMIVDGENSHSEYVSTFLRMNFYWRHLRDLLGIDI